MGFFFITINTVIKAKLYTEELYRNSSPTTNSIGTLVVPKLTD